MQKIYIDVTSFLLTKFLTGIQRVVKSVVLEMAENIPERLVFLAYDNDSYSFMLLDRDAFLGYLREDGTERADLISQSFLTPAEMGAGNIFFDIDSVWNLPCKRSALLPELKRTGLRLAVFVHDIIPITEPQFGHATTVFNFMSYIGAYLQYADLIITSTQSTLNEINKLSDQLGLPRIRGLVTGLGADFPEGHGIMLSREIKAATKRKYILCVGTIEPRKNHEYVLDAFEQGLFSRGLDLVFAGRLGWNMDAFQERMLASPYLNRQFFWLKGLDDGAIDYLYRHAYALAFPSANEGFGLPIVEALQRGTPVVTTDKPVMREVGGEYCEYVDAKDPKSMIDRIVAYDEDPAMYQAWKKKIESYVPTTWKEVGNRMVKALDTLRPAQYTVKRKVRQMVLLTARPSDLARSLPFVDAFMPFLEEVVVCCPDKVKSEMEQAYRGRLRIKVLTDSQVLNGIELPKDHQARNFLLRCQVMRSGQVDEVFIMGDDDYRPLETIDLQQFIMGNRYRAYYFYDISRWHVYVGEPTSYDIGQDRTLDFLRENHYPTMQYSSHMPQIIDRALYLEMLDTHQGLENRGVDEWSVYFNYLQYHYPDLISAEPFVTIGWPAHGSDWTLYTMPQAFLFENYYEELYDKGGIFEGFSKEYYPGIEEENREKIRITSRQLNIYRSWKERYLAFSRSYEMKYGGPPSFCLTRRNGELQLTLPRELELPLHGVVRVPFYCNLSEESFEATISLLDGSGNYVMLMPTQLVRPFQHGFDLPIYGGAKRTKAGKYNMAVEFAVGNERIRKMLPATCL